MHYKTTELAQARRRIAEKQKLAREALRKFKKDCATRGVPVFASVRAAA